MRKYLVAFICLAFACKSKQATVASKGISESQTTSSETCRLDVNFGSAAAGPDGKKIEALKKLIESYPKKLSYTVIPWGKEGEQEYCLKLTELSSAEQVEFVKKARQALAGGEIISVEENIPPINKRK